MLFACPLRMICCWGSSKEQFDDYVIELAGPEVSLDKANLEC